MLWLTRTVMIPDALLSQGHHILNQYMGLYFCEIGHKHKLKLYTSMAMTFLYILVTRLRHNCNPEHPYKTGNGGRMSTILAYTAGSNNGQSIIQQSDSHNADSWYKCLPLAAYFSYLFCGPSSLHLELSAAQDKCDCFKEIQKKPESFFPYTRMIT